MTQVGLIERFLIWRLKNLRTKTFVLILSGIVGIVAGLAAVILKVTVHQIQQFFVEGADLQYTNILYIFLPLVGLFLTYTVARFIFKDTGGHGIPDLLYTISKKRSIVPQTHMYSRAVTSAITVGFGGSVGLEAPIVVTGSAIGSNIGRMMHLNAKKRALLIGCGTAGAISAIFGAPIGAVLFAVEVILMEVSVGAFVPLLIASVTGSLTSMILLGKDVMFTFTLQDQFIAAHTPLYLLLGIFTGLVSIYTIRSLLKTEKQIHRQENPWLRILSGGCMLGLLIFLLPPIYGEGYDTLQALIDGQPLHLLSNSLFFSGNANPYLLMAFMALIILVKPIASSLTIGSGGSGGLFAPSLFIGGVAGFLFAYVNNFLGWYIPVPLAHFTLVAMCGVMSGVQHAPLSAIFLIAEVTGGYELFIPLMLVSAISFSTTTYFQKNSLYKQQLLDQGRYLPETKDEEVLGLINVRSIMESDLLPIHPDALLKDLCSLVKLSKRNIFPVVDEKGILHGVVTLDDVRDIMFDKEKQETVEVRVLMTKPPAYVSPREDMQEVMDKFERTGAWNLPVVEKGKYIGFISKSRIFNVYRKKLIKQQQD
ncbi:MAG TPA: chloride channel protein [Cyclobacteriaceae bacterium]|nr:chloride channel protein [Cyclobacteriaceae bacterium]